MVQAGIEGYGYCDAHKMDEGGVVIRDGGRGKELVVYVLWRKCSKKVEMGKQPMREG